MIEAGFQLLKNRLFLVLLLFINIGGTIYGYIWYDSQLAITPPRFLLFVPDSPTASLFFCFVLLAFILGKNWPLLEAFASVTLLKYGVWAVVLIIVPTFYGAELYWTHYMLIVSHLGMAVQGLLYSPYYRIKPWHFIVVAIWTLHNDVIDYIYGMHPWVHSTLSSSIQEIAYFTFWLSIFSLGTVYILNSKMIKRDIV